MVIISLFSPYKEKNMPMRKWAEMRSRRGKGDQFEERISQIWKHGLDNILPCEVVIQAWYLDWGFINKILTLWKTYNYLFILAVAKTST